VTSSSALARLIRLHVVPLSMPPFFALTVGRRYMFRRVSQTAVNYRGSSLSEGHAGRVRGGDRLPRVKMDLDGVERDNFAPLTSLDWQVHVYAAAAPDFQAAGEERKLPLHLFPWLTGMLGAGLRRNAAYLVRPDGYVAIADPAGSAARVASYLDARVRSCRRLSSLAIPELSESSSAACAKLLSADSGAVNTNLKTEIVWQPFSLLVSVMFINPQILRLAAWWLAVNSTGVAISIFIERHIFYQGVNAGSFHALSSGHEVWYISLWLVCEIALGALQVLTCCWLIFLVKVRSRFFRVALGVALGILTALLFPLLPVLVVNWIMFFEPIIGIYVFLCRGSCSERLQEISVQKNPNEIPAKVCGVFVVPLLTAGTPILSHLPVIGDGSHRSYWDRRPRCLNRRAPAKPVA
jgi:hypothetical protein